MTETTPAPTGHTYMMRSGSNTVFASNSDSERGKLRYRGWQRVTLPEAARTMGSKGTLISAVAHCNGGEIERISELGEIRIVCHGHGAANTATANDWHERIDLRTAAAERLAASIPASS